MTASAHRLFMGALSALTGHPKSFSWMVKEGAKLLGLPSFHVAGICAPDNGRYRNDPAWPALSRLLWQRVATARDMMKRYDSRGDHEIDGGYDAACAEHDRWRGLAEAVDAYVATGAVPA